MARAAANDSLAAPQSRLLLDTLARRLRLLGGAVAGLRAGLAPRNQPHVLSDARRGRGGWQDEKCLRTLAKRVCSLNNSVDIIAFQLMPFKVRLRVKVSLSLC